MFNEIFDQETIKILKDEMAQIVDDFDVENEKGEDFETKANNRADFFLNSAW